MKAFRLLKKVLAAVVIVFIAVEGYYISQVLWYSVAPVKTSAYIESECERTPDSIGVSRSRACRKRCACHFNRVDIDLAVSPCSSYIIALKCIGNSLQDGKLRASVILLPRDGGSNPIQFFLYAHEISPLEKNKGGVAPALRLMLRRPS